MNQTINVAIKSDEDSEVGNRFDVAADVVTFSVQRGKLFPGIAHALFDPE